ncbi:hypothetical protein PTTG_27341 [Puccinia triticina 1-1 BBBD Race 1]|uniref:Retrovirus-related Pol polyprotein from transposon TNT 1-94-like beta-barrel domain-containing protein n=1 Tax=Puccinia triticina (isolate 1-1 / race 1 (BBBD)) TaxID=630390 RepID=A0A180GLI6_PUCT1|nr:hypothetical protein PTTG_27341 [Puccinia triticina 1-1 BBBD Race 1]
MVKQAFDDERTGSISSSLHATAINNTPRIKQESALAASNPAPFCTPGVHNPDTNHSEKKCRALKNKKPTAKSATIKEPASDDDDQHDSSSISTTSSGLLCIRKALSAVKSNDVCFLDSGASHHMFSDKSRFTGYRKRSTQIALADGNHLESVGEGYVTLIANDGTISSSKRCMFLV